MRQRILLILDCDHVIPGKTYVTNLTELCPVDQTVQKIKAVHEFEWKAECTQCKWARWCGLSQQSAIHMANIHAVRRNHPARVAYRKNPVAAQESHRLEDLLK